MAYEAVAYARAGLIGNPSDGYFGKTISFTFSDFAAKVSLYENPEVEVVPSLRDRSAYGSVRELVEDVKAYGYYGGIRLMKATIRRFVEWCDENRVDLPERNFSIRYRTTIPRHVGLAGSSALVTATLRCLMEHYDVAIPKTVQPGLVLSVESGELGISAGLQDRVVQVYEGCVYMDFARELMDARGYGLYEEMDPSWLPDLFVAYRTDLAEGSEVYHNDLRERWQNGDPEVHQAMADFAGYAEEVGNLLKAGRGDAIGPWLDKNFDRRRSISEIAPKNIEMVERARNAGAHCKFSGSGGAIVGTCADDATFEAVCAAFEGTGTVVIRPQVVGG